MKQLKFLSTLFLFPFLFACGPTVTFNEPQPESTENLAKFPNRLLGNYISLADNSTLSIGEKLIVRIYDYDYKIHSGELDSGSKLLGDTLVDEQTQERILIKHDGDSLVAHVHYSDTLFHMNEDNLVRKFKGYYFLNTRRYEGSWEVKKIQLSKGQLSISSISLELDFANLKEITETAQDTVPPYTFAVTKKQFKEFIKNDGFSDNEKFVRLK